MVPATVARESDAEEKPKTLSDDKERMSGHNASPFARLAPYGLARQRSVGLRFLRPPQTGKKRSLR